MNEIKLNNISNYELRKFITYKRSLGYSYSGAILYQLKHIDCMILEFQELHQLSDDTVLSKKCVEYIISKKEANQKYTYASLLRQFGLYLVKMGKKAYVIPKKSLPARKRQFNPYIFDNEEIYNVIRAVDNYCQNNQNLKPYIKKTMPLIIRLLCSCGLRISETLNLKRENINLTKKYIFIKDAKNNKCRYVPLSESMCKCLEKYQNEVFFVNKLYFQLDNSKPLTKEVVYYRYKKIIKKIGYNENLTNKKMSLHTLRHTAAVHMIEKMISNGINVNQDIYLLSCLLGHEKITETEVYIHLPYYKFNDMSHISVINELFPKVKENET